MGKKGLASIFSRLIVDSSSPASGPAATPPWPWPPCGTNPQTASFRRPGDSGEEPCCATTTTAAGATRSDKPMMARGAAAGEMYKTVNSVHLDDSAAADVDLFDEVEEEGGELLLDDDVDSFSTTTASEEWSEAVICSLGRTSTDRFFFDPSPLPASNSILASSAHPSPPARKPAAPPAADAETETEAEAEMPPDPDDDGDEAETCASAPKSLAEGSVAVAVDSGDPYGDFLASMEEMVSAHGLRDWAALEELLACYLRINGKQHHHVIVGAFVDLLLGLSSSDTATATTSSSSSGSACAGSRCTTTTSTSTAATTSTSTTAAAAEQCGGGNEAAACSSSSSCADGADVQDDVAEEKASSAAATGDDRASAPLRRVP